MASTDVEAFWRSWDELADASLSGDKQRIGRAFWALPTAQFFEMRNESPARWQRAFELLLELALASDDQDRRYFWDGLLTVVTYWALVQHDDDDASRSARQHKLDECTRALLAALVRELERLPAPSMFALLEQVIDRLITIEGFAQSGAHAAVSAWLDERRQRDPAARAMHLLYVVARMPWPASRELLFAHLDDPDDRVRAAAATAIGHRYLEREVDEDAAPFAEVVEQVTAMELARPGVAAGLLNPFSTGDMDLFARVGGLDLEAWMAHILTNRAGPEPDLLPICVGIDFHAHELFSDRPERTAALLGGNADEVAVEAATEVRGRVEGMEPVLLQLAASSNDHAARRAAWHLAEHYRIVVPAAEARGFVAGYPQAGGELVTACLTGSGEPEGQPLSITVHPPAPAGAPNATAAFDDVAAQAWVDRLLPASIRDHVLFDLPFELLEHEASTGATLRRYRVPTGLFMHFASGAFVEYLGDASALRWSRVHIGWRGAPGVWSPIEACTDGMAASDHLDRLH